ncbi:hypothetical protein CA267_001810 [Alteromonas pelagimontana]|uniref:Uncharacterized protein n=1 Tax=Alteromonas pelagimontana TaxID=1858656 RepID=A0A6M4M9H0_9ALTE|nr:hypothetical protein [Alteromonas pelagimontana]QJR79619.1 hypothetical protein CA267_001810 [Alteromonas pelagimontana]
MNLLKRFIDIVVPRFIEEWVALKEVNEHLVPVCCIDDVKEHEYFKWMAKSRGFNLFGAMLFPQFGEPVPFVKSAKVKS